MDDNRRLFNMVYKNLIKYFDKDAANEIQKEYEKRHKEVEEELEKYIEGVLRERPS